MKQFILPSEPDKDGKLKLFGRDFHYLAHVRRVKTGDSVNAVLPCGDNAKAKVACVTREYVEILVDGERGSGSGVQAQSTSLSPTPYPLSPTPTIFLFQAMIKGVKMDMVVRQAAECGAAAIVPFEAARSIKRPSLSTNTSPQLARWRRIVREARQQSGSVVATEVYAPLSLDGLFEFWRGCYGDSAIPHITCILLHTEGSSVPLHSAVKKNCAVAALAVGPEGGFSGREAQRFKDAGFVPVSLGSAILRAESAALAGLAALRLLLLERDSWKLVNA